MQITTRLEFDAGHRIPNHKSQCRNLHGHRYAIEITLSGDIIQQEGASENGMVMDFSDVKAIARRSIVDVGIMLFWSIKMIPPYSTFSTPCPTIKPSSSTASPPQKTWPPKPLESFNRNTVTPTATVETRTRQTL